MHSLRLLHSLLNYIFQQRQLLAIHHHHFNLLLLFALFLFLFVFFLFSRFAFLPLFCFWARFFLVLFALGCCCVLASFSLGVLVLGCGLGALIKLYCFKKKIIAVFLVDLEEGKFGNLPFSSYC